MIKVSCIVPCYNLGHTSKRCIESLLGQTLENIEIILVNDCSTDDTLKVLKEYEENYTNILVIDSKINLRQGGARNLGLEKSEGEFVCFIDGDDWIESTMLEELYNEAKLSGADIVDSDYFQDDENSNVEKRVSIPDNIVKEQKIEKFIVNPGRIWTKIIKRTLLIENQIRFIEGVKFEDNPYLPILYPYINKLSKVNKNFYHYQYNSNSTSRVIDDYSVFDRLKTAKFLMEESIRRNLYLQYKDEFDFQFLQLFYVNTYITCLLKFSAPPLDKIKEIYREIHVIYPEYRKNPYVSKMPTYFKVIVHSRYFNLKLMAQIWRIAKKTKFNKALIGRVKS